MKRAFKKWQTQSLRTVMIFKMKGEKNLINAVSKKKKNLDPKSYSLK